MDDANAHALGGAMVLALASLLPALAYLAFVRWLDRYDREPGYLVAAAFFWGATGGIFFGGFASLVLAIPATIAFGSGGGEFLAVVVFAPLTEEISKAMVLVALSFHDQFDGVVDGMVYGAAVGLGFAAVENFFYFVGADTPAELVALILMRTGYTMVGHGVATSCTGAALGYAKFNRRHWLIRFLQVLAGLVLAMALHALGNFVCVVSGGAEAPALFLLNLAGLAIALTIHLTVMQVSLPSEARVLAEELAKETDVPPELARLIGSYFERVRHQLGLLFTLRWPTVLRFQKLCRSATQLAVKRRQSLQRPELQRTVDGLRDEVRALIAAGWQ